MHDGLCAQQNGDTPLHLAAAKGRRKITMLLLKHNANVNARAKNLCTPLHYAAGSRSTFILKALLEAGGDPTIESFTCQTVDQIARIGRRMSVGVAASRLQAKRELQKVRASGSMDAS